MKGWILLMPPPYNELIFDGLMSSRISEIESLGGHTYNRPELLHESKNSHWVATLTKGLR